VFYLYMERLQGWMGRRLTVTPAKAAAKV